jgi:hypothetical protein
MDTEVHGLIGYFRRGAQTGRERFAITTAADGARTLRAHCEMWDDELLRDVTLAIDADYRPLDAFIRLAQHGKFVGSSWFRFGAGFVECEAWTARDGRVSQRMDWDGWPICFGTHSLITDGWHAQHWHGRDPGRLSSPVSSNAANGGTGPLIATTEFQLAHHGDETVRVAAGEFACRHFSIAFRSYAPIHFWVTGAQHQFVRMEWDHLDANYELLELSEMQR